MAPAGNPFSDNINASTEAFSVRVMLRGRPSGIEIRMLSNNSPTERPFQVHRKSGPASAGAVSPPSSSGPWHSAQDVSYSPAPVEA